MNKQELRQAAKQIRSNLNIEQISIELAHKLVERDEYKASKNIMVFYPLKDEVNLLSIVNDETKKFYLPKICGNNLLCCPYNAGDNTCISGFRTQEPLTKALPKNIIDMVVIPALACDKNKYRLGYGRGFYDRFLSDYNGVKIVCIPQLLVFETVYPENHDIKADLIITEKDDF